MVCYFCLSVFCWGLVFFSRAPSSFYNRFFLFFLYLLFVVLGFTFLSRGAMPHNDIEVVRILGVMFWVRTCGGVFSFLKIPEALLA